MKTIAKLLNIVRLHPIASREELIDLCVETTRLTIDRDTLVVRKDDAIAAIVEEHDPLIESLNGQIDRNVERMRKWSLSNRTEEFGDKQGIKVAGCTLEFRKGTGKVVTEDGDKKAVNNILALPNEMEKEIEELTTIKVELDKNGVKRLAKTEAGRAILADLGIRIVVEEVFSFTPAREDLAPLKVSTEPTAQAAA
jgi:phage host-nuclease inhibitor protein Gam